MSPEQLDAIQARTDAATEGPWFREYSDVVTAHPDPRDVEEGYEDARNARVVRGAPHLPKKDRQGIADANFIASSRTDVPALLAYARDLEARIRRVEALAEAFDESASQASYSGSEDQMETWLLAASRIRAALTATEGQA